MKSWQNLNLLLTLSEGLISPTVQNYTPGEEQDVLQSVAKD